MADLGATSGTGEPVAGPVAVPGALKANPHPRHTAVIPPSEPRGKEPQLSVLVAPPLESDGTLPVRVAADAIDACRTAWASVCALHTEILSKVSPLNSD